MPKILQINVTSNWGSTGKIAEQIGQLVIENGWESYIAYGRYHNQSYSKTIKIGSALDVYEHYAENKILDNEGLASRKSTRSLIDKIKHIDPDIIHLHNIHDHYLNYPILFEYLRSANKPVIWTQHDCWAYTGGCMYYEMLKCNKWKTKCEDCPEHRALCDKSKSQYLNKKKYFSAINNLILVPVSIWLDNELHNSFLKDKKSVIIPNGVDTNLFKPSNNLEIFNKYNIKAKHILIGVANVWSKRKGLYDYIKLSTYLDSDTIILLVGLNKKQIKDLPPNIIGIQRIADPIELVALYSASDIVLNLSREETFGLTTIEGFACGTPGIVYNKTASPELITPDTGYIVEEGHIKDLYEAISIILHKGKRYYSKACREKAIRQYNSKDSYNKYINLYRIILQDTW